MERQQIFIIILQHCIRKLFVRVYVNARFSITSTVNIVDFLTEILKRVKFKKKHQDIKSVSQSWKCIIYSNSYIYFPYVAKEGVQT